MTDEAEACVYIVDDDPSIREALSNLFLSVGLGVQTFATASEFLSDSGREGPCCLVLDVRLPEMSGLELQRKLLDSGRLILTIFITAHGDIQMSVRAMKAGAAEFLTKPFRDQDLLDAVQEALKRDRIRTAGQQAHAALRRRYGTLSLRERQVMSLVVTGMLNKQIAGELGTTEATVKLHRGHVMRKMKASSLPDLVRLAERLQKNGD